MCPARRPERTFNPCTKGPTPLHCTSLDIKIYKIIIIYILKTYYYAFGITQIPENIPMIANEDFPEELQNSKFNSRILSTRNLPTKEELLNKYNELGSWRKTERFYKIGLKTREKIINS